MGESKDNVPDSEEVNDWQLIESIKSLPGITKRQAAWLTFFYATVSWVKEDLTKLHFTLGKRKEQEETHLIQGLVIHLNNYLDKIAREVLLYPALGEFTHEHLTYMQEHWEDKLWIKNSLLNYYALNQTAKERAAGAEMKRLKKRIIYELKKELGQK